MAEELATTNSNQPTAPPIVLCDEPGCPHPAVFSYSWDWGKSGSVCALHQAQYVQLQESLGRRCAFGTLQTASAGDPPLVRSERIQLRAEIGTLEAELVEAKARGLDLYNQNIELSRQVQTLKVRDTEAQAQVKDARAMLQGLESRLARREAELGDATQEVQRLKALIPREPPPAGRTVGKGVRSGTVTTTGKSVVEGGEESTEEKK